VACCVKGIIANYEVGRTRNRLWSRKIEITAAMIKAATEEIWDWAGRHFEDAATLHIFSGASGKGRFTSGFSCSRSTCRNSLTRPAKLAV